MTVSAAALEAHLTSVQTTDRGFELRVRLRNHADRSLHYISDCRAILYDAASRKLTVRLSDEGRVMRPRLGNRDPKFRHIDPGAEAELAVQLPERITKFAPAPDPERRQVAFVQQRIADAEEVTVEIAWADVPFYEDSRGAKKSVLPSVNWQQHVLKASLKRDRAH